MPRFAAKKAPGRRTLPPWPEPINFPQYNPVRFVLAEPEAKRYVLRLLGYATGAFLLGTAAGFDLAAWLNTPHPWAMLSRLARWWFQ